MNLYDLPAYEEGCNSARYCLGSNNSGHGIHNPYPYNTAEWRAWNLGWNETLRSEQP